MQEEKYTLGDLAEAIFRLSDNVESTPEEFQEAADAVVIIAQEIGLLELVK